MEKWKEIPGSHGKYQVNNNGVFRSLCRKKVKVLKLYKLPTGYMQVNLGQRTYYAHRIVWEAFNGPIPAGLQINHINEDKTDNRLDNLNLMTPKENHNWGTGIERQRKAAINGGNSKRVLQYDLNGEFIKEWPSLKEIYRVLGLAYQNISKCCLGEAKTAYGSVWKYKEINIV